MQQLVQSVQRLEDIMEEISAASNEQASGIEQVDPAVIQMDEVTQQNAALVEQNIPLNPEHPEATEIKVQKVRRWLYDARVR